MKYMYQLIMEKTKLSKENAALLASLMVLAGIMLLTVILVSVCGLWNYADTMISLTFTASAILIQIWMLNL